MAVSIDGGAEAQGGAALLQSAGKAAQEGDMLTSKALFEQAVQKSRLEQSTQLEREACLGAAEMSWQVSQRREIKHAITDRKINFERAGTLQRESGQLVSMPSILSHNSMRLGLSLEVKLNNGEPDQFRSRKCDRAE